MVAELIGPCKVSLSQDAEGYKVYKVQWKVRTALGDGPQVVNDCPGLPVAGSTYQLMNDSDPWVWLRQDRTINVLSGEQEEAAQIWLVEGTYSNKPNDPNKQRCNDTPIEDPLTEPPKISGSSVKYTEEATRDRFNNPITTSSFEQIRGPHNEWDANRAQVTIEMNVANLNLPLLDACRDHVNDRPMWGLNSRCIKLSTYTWDRKFWKQCSVYYTWKLTFDTDIGTFDRDMLDEGTKALSGRWVGDQYRLVNFQPGNIVPDPLNPLHFIKFADKNGQPCKCILNGSGMPAGVTLGVPQVITGTEVIANGDSFLTIISQPTGGPNYPKLTIVIEDVNASITEGTVDISGEDEHGNVTQESISLLQGDGTYLTTNRWSHVTSLLLNGVIGAGTGGTSDTIQVLTNTSQSEAGNIHVEKYDEANFLLLGVPLTW